MSGNPDDIIRPTRQRMRLAPGFDELTETQSGGVTRRNGAVRVWSNLEDTWRKRLITDEQFHAGQKYYLDHELGGFNPRVTSRLAEWVQSSGASGDLDAAERRVFHQRRFAEANKILDGMGVRKAMIWFVVCDHKLEAIGRKFWGYRGGRSASASSRVMVSMALQQLARFYGIAK